MENPTFSFSWDNASVPKKVFARKRKPPGPKSAPQKQTDASTGFKQKVIDRNSNVKPSEKQPSKEIVSSSNQDQAAKTRLDKNKRKNTLIVAEQPNESQSKSFESKQSGHIKRKKNKDKLLAKQLADEGNEVEQRATQGDPKNYSLFTNVKKDVYVNTSAGKSVSEKVFVGGSFKDLDVHKHVVSNLEKMNFLNLTNVQAKAIPIVMSGKDTLIRSQTGSGKTLAYAVPMIDALQGITPKLKRSDGVQAIIVVPTRELALQTHELFTKLNTFQWLVVSNLCGGESRKSEKDRIRKGITVLIGTPGRLLDHVLHTSSLKIDTVRCLVLDEADRLLDMGFRKDILSLVDSLDKSKTNATYDPMALMRKNAPEDSTNELSEDTPPLKNPQSKRRQTILLSATLNKGVTELADFTMAKDHEFVDGLDHASNAITDSFVIPDTVKQEFVVTYVKHRLFTLSAMLVEKAKQSSCKVFVFMASTQMVEYHHELFSKCLVKMPVNRGKYKVGNVAIADDESDSDDEETDVLDVEFFKLHGNMDQKTRKEVFRSFKLSPKGVLLCTDVAARGLDVPEADCIIQYTGPQTDEDYLHRIGRTGRAGKSGSAVIFLTHEEQEFVNHLRQHRVFLKQCNLDKALDLLRDLMDEPDQEAAATALQKRYEKAVAKDASLYKSACFAYSTWSRFYNSYPTKMREFFNFKKANLGHYVTSFALRDTPTTVAKVVRGQVVKVEAPRLNKKLANHADNVELTKPNKAKKKTPRSISLTTSEFSSGLEPPKKKKKKT